MLHHDPWRPDSIKDALLGGCTDPLHAHHHGFILDDETIMACCELSDASTHMVYWTAGENGSPQPLIMPLHLDEDDC